MGRNLYDVLAAMETATSLLRAADETPATNAALAALNEAADYIRGALGMPTLEEELMAERRSHLRLVRNDDEPPF
jgi:hypothetical protein